MKKVFFTMVCAFVLLSAAIGIKAQSEPTPFAGNWMLDREKTPMSKDFPEKLRNFKMMVGGSAATVAVKSQVEGDVELRAAGRGAITPVTESASQARGGAPAVSGTESSASNGKVNYGGTMALFFTVKDATYDLSGKEVKTENSQGLTTVKAKPDKNGKGLQITTFRRMKMPKGEMEIYVRESWKLSEDGKTLKLQRTVETPTARDEILMFLSKVG
jgi:hypothetical protein